MFLVTVSVRWSVGRLVGPVFAFLAFASSFHMIAPAQPWATDAVMYRAPLTAPAPHITAPAQPHVTDAVMYMALLGEEG